MNNILGTTPTTTLSHSGIRSFYAALAANDLGAIVPLLAPDATLHVPGTQPLSGDHSGLDAILAFLLTTTAVTRDGERVELIDALVGHHHAAAYVHVTADRTGYTSLDNHTIHLFHLDGGLITDIWFHNRDQAAVDTFWS